MEKPRQLPSGRWQARLVGPNGRRYSAGVHATKSDAKAAQVAKLAELNAKHRKGIKESKRITFGDYADLYMQGRRPGEAAGLARTSRGVYQSCLRRSLIPAFGKKFLDQITTLSIRQWWQSKEPTQGRQSEFYLLRQILQQATEDGLIDQNPAKIKGSGADMSKRRPTLTAGQVGDLCEKAESLQTKALIILLAGSGMRIGEALALDWSDIEMLSGRVSIVKHWTPHGITDGTKNKRIASRSVALPPWAVDAVLEHYKQVPQRDDTDPMFVNAHGRRLSHDVFRREFAKLRERVGLPEIHIHDLRHFALTTYAQTPGTTLRDVMARGGHSTEKMALRYQHANDERDAQQAQKMPSPFVKTV